MQEVRVFHSAPQEARGPREGRGGGVGLGRQLWGEGEEEFT